MLSFATIRVEPTFHEASWPDEHICAMRAVDTPSALAASDIIRRQADLL